MASDTEPEVAPEPVPCNPCRGTGKLSSGLGGTPHEVECPWCGGSGVFTPGHDAQAAGPADPDGGPVEPAAAPTDAA